MSLELSIPSTPSTELLEYEQRGNKAIEQGRIEECISWYMKGLKRAKELKFSEESRNFSLLIATLL